MAHPQMTGWAAGFRMSENALSFRSFISAKVRVKFFPEMMFPIRRLAAHGVMVWMMASRLEKQMRQDNQSPGLPESNDRQSENRGHEPVPEQPDEPAKNKGDQHAEENPSENHSDDLKDL
jgi:hypothetical protein